LIFVYHSALFSFLSCYFIVPEAQAEDLYHHKIQAHPFSEVLIQASLLSI
jgi:hypothetical protein